MISRIAAARANAQEILVKIDSAEPKIPDQKRKIIGRVLSGETYEAVGRDFKISRERVRCICALTLRSIGWKVE